MKRRILLSLVILSFGVGAIYGASKTYKYRCPKCKLIQEYEVPGNKKCPNDGKTMIRVY